MDHYFFEGGLGNLQKNSCTVKTTEKKLCKGSRGEKIEQLFSTIHTLCLTLKKFFTSHSPPKKHAQPKGEQKVPCPRKLKR